MIVLKILQVILVMSVLVLVHETGHFFFAKIFGIKVEKFYLFFDIRGFCLFSTKRSRLIEKWFPKLKDIETDYGIGWLPLGGYCKISGLNASSVDSGITSWQRLLVLYGGVLFNFIFAAVIYTCLLFFGGKTYLSHEDNSIIAGQLASEIGFQTGDRILAIDDYHPEMFESLREDLIRRAPCSVMALRDIDTIRISIGRSWITEMLESPLMFQPESPVVRKDEYGLVCAVGEGVRTAVGTTADCVRDIRLFLTPSTGVYRSVGSFIAIGQALPSAWNWRMFFIMMAALSIILGVMNILPVPPLDGGLIMIALVEMVTGRKMGRFFRLVVQLIGLTLLLMLFLLASCNDILRLVSN